jgi:hypothetical protein
MRRRIEVAESPLRRDPSPSFQALLGSCDPPRRKFSVRTTGGKTPRLLARFKSLCERRQTISLTAFHRPIKGIPCDNILVEFDSAYKSLGVKEEIKKQFPMVVTRFLSESSSPSTLPVQANISVRVGLKNRGRMDAYQHRSPLQTPLRSVQNLY